MRKILDLFLFVLLLQNGVINGQPYSNSFLKSISREQNVRNVIIANQSEPVFKLPSIEKNGFSGQEIIWQKGRGWIIHNGSPRIYEILNDSLVRLDETKHSGYSFGAALVRFRDTIFSIGGYGFWSVNGSVRFFNEKMKEWDIIKCNNEAPFANGINGFSYYDSKTEKLYVIYSKYNPEYLINQSIEKGVFVQIFDFKTKTWSNDTFVFNEDFASQLSDINSVRRGPSWIIVNSAKFKSSLLLDFRQNLIYEVSDPKTTELIQLLANHKNHIIYNTDENVKIFDRDNDSVITYNINASELTPLDKPIYVKKTQWMSMTNIKSILLVVSIIMISILFYFTVRLKKQKNKGSNTLIVEKERQDFKAFVMNLDELEKQVLRKVVECSYLGEKTSVNQLNKILGTERKDFKIQNNIRSEVILSINNKFKAYSSMNDMLIDRQRTAIDKRYMEYYINGNLKSKFPLKLF